MVWDNCVLQSTKFIYLKDNFIELSQPHITYQKANNIVVKFVEEDVQNIDLLKSALRNHLRTIQYVYSLLFPKIYNRTNRFGINSKSHFDFAFNNWKHHKNNIVFPTPTRNRVVEQPKTNSSRKWYNSTTITTTTKWRNFRSWKKDWKLWKKSCSSFWANTRKK